MWPLAENSNFGASILISQGKVAIKDTQGFSEANFCVEAVDAVKAGSQADYHRFLFKGD